MNAVQRTAIPSVQLSRLVHDHYTTAASLKGTQRVQLPKSSFETTRLWSARHPIGRLDLWGAGKTIAGSSLLLSLQCKHFASPKLLLAMTGLVKWRTPPTGDDLSAANGFDFKTIESPRDTQQAFSLRYSLKETRSQRLCLAKPSAAYLSLESLLFDLASQSQTWWVEEDLNFRPRPYQGRALTN